MVRTAWRRSADLPHPGGSLGQDQHVGRRRIAGRSRIGRRRDGGQEIGRRPARRRDGVDRAIEPAARRQRLRDVTAQRNRRARGLHEFQGEVAPRLIVLPLQLEGDAIVFGGANGQIAVRAAHDRIRPRRPHDLSRQTKIPDRLQIREQGQVEMVRAVGGLQRNRVVQQDPLRIAGDDGKDTNLEQAVADLFQNGRIAAAN